MKKDKKFDFEQFQSGALKKMKKGSPLLGKEGVFTPLLKEFLEAGLSAELEDHLEQDRKPNRKNGKGKKKVKSTLGTVELRSPRDRNGTFDPKLISKRQTVLSEDLDELIIFLYSQGSSYLDIRKQLERFYGVEISETTISRVTDKVWPEVQEWRSRPLEAVYPFVWMDAIHYKVRDEGRVVNKAVYCVLGVDQEGKKDLLGMYLGESEGAKFWLQVLTDLKNRGIEDIFIACIDNLTGFADAIEGVFPKTQVQLCIIHQIRNSRRYIPWKEIKAFMVDLKRVYRALTKDEAERELDKLESIWGKKYPVVIESWRRNWDRLSTYFQYTPEIRRVIYTTNIIEGFNRQLRKATKTKGAFTSDEALFKLLYLVQLRVTENWSKGVFNWNAVLSQLSIIFGDRLKLKL